jgi:hypothetical protein
MASLRDVVAGIGVGAEIGDPSKLNVFDSFAR